MAIPLAVLPRSCLVFVLSLSALLGCQAGPENRPIAAAAQPPAESGAAGMPDRPAVLIDGEVVGWAAVQPWLAETAGGTVLQEMALDRRLAREFVQRTWTLADDEVREERTRLARTMALTSAGGEPGADQAERLLDRLRRDRGLGEARFAALLRRSAMLRRLVADEVVIDEGALVQLHAVRHGPRLQGRIIVVDSHAEAAALAARLSGAGSDMPAQFSRAAMAQSTDESRAWGGVLPAFSTEDASAPLVLRRAAAGLQPGQLSGVLALERGFGLFLLDAVVPGSGRTLEQARDELRFEARLRQERLLMDRLAARYLREANVQPQDRGLDWSWRSTRRPG